VTILKTEKISHNFNQLKVLEKISLEIKKGQFVSLVGPLGCGKTTLLKILEGLVKPSKGKVFFNRQRLIKPSRKISFVFQKPALMPWRTVTKNISLPLEIAGLPQKKTEKKVRQILKLINLTGFKDYYPASLSGGMKQLTSIARAFVSPSQLLLLDEPFASLDALTREKMNLQLLKLWQKKKKTIILVTHSLQEAVFLTDQVIVLSKKPAKIKKIIKTNLDRPRKLCLLNKKEINQKIRQIRAYF